MTSATPYSPDDYDRIDSNEVTVAADLRPFLAHVLAAITDHESFLIDLSQLALRTITDRGRFDLTAPQWTLLEIARYENGVTVTGARQRRTADALAAAGLVIVEDDGTVTPKEP